MCLTHSVCQAILSLFGLILPLFVAELLMPKEYGCKTDGMNVKIPVVPNAMVAIDHQCLTVPISVEVCYPLKPRSLS